MVAAQQIQPAIELRQQCYGVFFLTQSQISQVKDGFAGLNEAIPVFNDQLLPAFRSIAILTDIGMEEMRIRDQSGIVCQR